MIQALFTLTKLVIFAAVVLIVSHWIRFSGKTLSEHVAAMVSHPEVKKTVHQVERSTREILKSSERTPAAKGHLKPEDTRALRNFLERIETSNSAAERPKN
jgi:hypothetical protein